MVALAERIGDALLGGGVDESWLREIESRDNIFPNVDYRLYAT